MRSMGAGSIDGDLDLLTILEVIDDWRPGHRVSTTLALVHVGLGENWGNGSGSPSFARQPLQFGEGRNAARDSGPRRPIGAERDDNWRCRFVAT